MAYKSALIFFLGVAFFSPPIHWSDLSWRLTTRYRETAIKGAAKEESAPAKGHARITGQVEDHSTCWFKSETRATLTGVALVIHGLNLRPDKMMPIISALTDSGMHVLSLSLRGHGENYDHRLNLRTDEARLESFKSVSYGQWINESRRAYWKVKERGKQEKVPVFLAAFSVGGLVGLDLFAATPGIQFDKMVLFAPALRLRALLYLERLLSPFPRLVLPSLAPETYLSNKKGTPVAAYNALFQGLARFETHVSQKINVPALIFVDGEDEFIPLQGLKKLVAENHLDQWRFYRVRKGGSADSGTFHHHIIDAYSTGKDVWQQIKAEMVAHFREDALN